MNKYFSILIGALFFVSGLVTSQIFAQTNGASVQTEKQTRYACPMHAQEISATPGKCGKCGMALQTMADAVTEDFIVQIAAPLQRIKPQQNTSLRFTIFNPRTNAQVKDFQVQHEKLFHLFVVSSDLKYFEHIHPDLQRDGSFVVPINLPQAGMYHLLCDIFPTGGTPHIVHQSIVTAGFKGAASALQANLTPDQSFTKIVDGMQVELKFAPEILAAGQPALLRYDLTDAQTGQPITDLQPYLGAWGHTLILSEDAADYLHSHPLESAEKNVAATSPNLIFFETFFPRAGRYRIWTQLQRNHKISTVSFTITVP